MENTGRRKNGRLHKLITAVLASVFVASLVSTISTIAAANLFKIQSAELTELSATAEGTILSYDDLNVNSNVTFHKINDYAKYTITLKNNDSVEHVIESITDDNANPYVTYDYDQHANEQISAGENLVFVVTAKYNTAVTDINQRAQANNVKFFIHFTDIDEEVILVPNTGVSSNVGNTIRGSVITLIISAVGLVIIGIVILKKNKRASKYIIAGIIAVLAIVATATAKAATVEINSFTFMNNFALKDRLVVNWTDVNGNENETIVSYNESANIPDQSKNGHTFTGWADENGNPVDLTQPITDDIKVHPTFRIHRYTVRFAPNVPVDGTLDPVISMDDMSLVYDEEKNLTANQYNVTGYLFDSWNTASDGSGTKYEDMESIKNLSTVDGDVVTLYARWGATPYTVIFDKNHNDATGVMNSISKAYNETFNLPANTYTRTGYNFTGWNTSPVGDGTHYDDEQSVKNLDINGRITLYAEWAPIVAVITFDKNSDEATGSMANQTVVYDVQNRLNDNGFIRENYNFMGWNTQADGQGIHYDNKADVTNTFFTDTTLYAEWSLRQFTVVFNKNHEDAIGSMINQQIPCNQTVALRNNEYTREHYKFMGWAISAGSATVVYADGANVSNLADSGETYTLYAVWKESTATFATFGAPSTTNVSKFAHYTAGTPSAETLANATNIATRDSNFPIYGWEDGEYYYWWSEAESARIPSDSSRFFERNGRYVEITFDGIDTSHVTNAYAILHNNTRLKKVDLSNFDTSSLVNAMSMFEACYALETVILPEGFGQNVTDASRMFYGASKLKTINIADFDSTNLKNTTSMFNGATALASLTLPENFGKKITDASNMFNGTSIATMNIDDFVPEQPTSIYGMFAGTKMTSIDLSHWNFSSVTSLANLFNNCTNLISVDLGNWSKENITNMSGMFKNTAIADFSFLESWNVSSVENMSSMFEGTKDTQMDLSSWDVSKVKDMSNMFLSSSLTNLNISTWNTPVLENMRQMLRYARLTTLDISKLDTRNVTNMVWALTQISNLNTVYVGENWNTESITGGNGASMFDGTFRIVGGAGTVHINEQQYTNQSRARIDDPDNGKPGYFSIKGARYIRYNGNGADNSEYETMTSHYLTNTGSLKANAFVRNGFVFGGWNTAADGSGVDYADGQVMSDLTESKTPLTLYAMWLSPNGFNGTVDLTPQYSTANVLQKSSTMSQGYVGAAYFDPSDLSKRCNANSANVADKEAKTGCMKWYIYDDSGDSYEMILDHNTTKMITFNSSNNNSSPQALYDRLDADTADWDKTKLSTGILNAADVAAISGINSFNSANGTYYSLGTEVNSSNGKGRSAFGWLYDYTRECETHGCDHEVSTGYGHWTTTPVSGDKKKVWLINYFGRLTFTEAKLGNWGIRPIVTVSKSVVSGV